MRRTGGIAILPTRLPAVLLPALLTALLAGSMAGCAAVDDVAPTPARTAQLDTHITAGVKAALAADPVFQGADIDVATSAGIVQLSGFVSSADDVSAAAAVARTVKGVTSIRNDLRLK